MEKKKRTGSSKKLPPVPLFIKPKSEEEQEEWKRMHFKNIRRSLDSKVSTLMRENTNHMLGEKKQELLSLTHRLDMLHKKPGIFAQSEKVETSPRSTERRFENPQDFKKIAKEYKSHNNKKKHLNVLHHDSKASGEEEDKPHNKKKRLNVLHHDPKASGEEEEKPPEKPQDQKDFDEEKAREKKRRLKLL